MVAGRVNPSVVPSDLRAEAYELSYGDRREEKRVRTEFYDFD